MGGTLRKYLEAADALPDEPLIAVCPISVRTEEETGQTNNRVSAMFTSLATDVDDPEERLRLIHDTTKGAKEDHNAVGATFLTDWAEYAAPRTFALASRLYSQLNLADRHRPIHNVVISNVPGPPVPLYYGGAELIAAYPMGPIMEGAGMNITVMSYRDSVDIGFMVCRELVPDVWDLPDHVDAAMAELMRAAGLGPSPAKKRAPAKKAATKKRAPAKKAATKKARAGEEGRDQEAPRPRRRRPRSAPRPKKAASKKRAPAKKAGDQEADGDGSDLTVCQIRVRSPHGLPARRPVRACRRRRPRPARHWSAATSGARSPSSRRPAIGPPTSWRPTASARATSSVSTPPTRPPMSR